MAVRIQVRSGTATEWWAENPTLMEAELGAELDTGRFKVGDGETDWKNLGYASDMTSPPVVDSLESTATTSALSANQGNVLSGMIGDIGSVLDIINGEEEE